jgi:Fe-S cluster assembly protein SufD
MAVSTGEHVLAPVQQRGQAALGRLGLPTRKQEAWRLTNLSRLEAVARMPVNGVATASDAPPCLDGVVRLVLDGVNDPLEGVTLPEGLTPLEPKELELALGHTLDRCG